MAERKNSWYLKTGFTHRFYCACGQEDRYEDRISLHYHPAHRCSRCGNRRFLDAVALREDPRTLYWSPFVWEYEPLRDDEGWHVSAYLTMPFVDLRRQAVRFLPLYLATFSLLAGGKHRYRPHDSLVLQRRILSPGHTTAPIEERIKKELVAHLADFLARCPGERLAWLVHDPAFIALSPSDRIHAAAFFLRHPHLREFDFLHWRSFGHCVDASRRHPTVVGMLEWVLQHRRAKSLRRTLFSSYRQSMEELGFYDPIPDYLFARVLRDPNHLRRALAIPPALKSALFEGIALHDAFALFDFLSLHYPEGRIVTMFASVDRQTLRQHTIRDTARMLHLPAMGPLIREHFRRPAPDLRRLHDELVRLHRFHRLSLAGRSRFDYHPADRRAALSHGPFHYRLPQGPAELDAWARTLRNCMFSYTRAIHNGETVIYGVFEEETLRYAVELRDLGIVQALGKENRPLPGPHREAIERWVQEVYRRGWIEERENRTEGSNTSEP
jgi:hypothetical protein